ncbi:MAG: DNA cytosine methyltransferase [Candidatus Nanopelagicales bacterium]
MARGGSMGLTAAGLFAGIGGIEAGLGLSGVRPDLFCEVWEPARQVLQERFPQVPIHGDVTTLKSLPPVDLVTAGFPCTDLSQAGRTAGLDGKASGLVWEVFRLLSARKPPDWVLIENVRNMLPLSGGAAMATVVAQLEQRGYSWAYRVVDSRFTGVPQRRQRVILLASRVGDPRTVLHVDDAGERLDYRADAFGFYWTEGLRGLGWAQDAVPTLKGGSTIGIPSAPGIWIPGAPEGMRLVKPTLADAEAMQGLPRGWTSAVTGARVAGSRWKLVGNAVTVGVSRWVGERLASPGAPSTTYNILNTGDRWPLAAAGANGVRWRADLSMFPRHDPYQHLSELITPAELQPISFRGIAGFHDRLSRGNLRLDEDFRLDVKKHAAFMERHQAAS